MKILKIFKLKLFKIRKCINKLISKTRKKKYESRNLIFYFKSNLSRKEYFLKKGEVVGEN